MASCGPSCAIPSCSSAPVVGFGSSGSHLGGYGYGGSSYASGIGGSTSAAQLGILDGVIPKPINQVPPSECYIVPSPVTVTIPGAILSASCEPIRVGGHTPCAVEGVGLAGGLGSSYPLGTSGGFLRRRGSLVGQFGRICG